MSDIKWSHEHVNTAICKYIWCMTEVRVSDKIHKYVWNKQIFHIKYIKNKHPSIKLSTIIFQKKAKTKIITNVVVTVLRVKWHQQVIESVYALSVKHKVELFYRGDSNCDLDNLNQVLNQ